MMDFVLKTMIFVLKMMSFAFEMTNCMQTYRDTTLLVFSSDNGNYYPQSFPAIIPRNYFPQGF